MPQQQKKPDKMSKLTKEQEDIVTGIILWGLFSLFIPILGVPLTWKFGKKLNLVHKLIVTGIGTAALLFMFTSKQSAQSPILNTPTVDIQSSDSSTGQNENHLPQRGETVKVLAGSGSANLRSEPSIDAASLAKIANGTGVTIIDEATNDNGERWYKVQADGQIGWIFSDLLDSKLPPPTASISPPANTSAQLSPGEQFRQQYYKEIDELTNGSNVTVGNYARGTMQSWETQPDGIALGYRFSCQDRAEYNNDSTAVSKAAFQANNGTIPFEQLLVYNEARFRAASFVGCL